MKSKKLFQILFGVVIIGVFIAVVYYMGKEYGWFGRSIEPTPTEREKSKEELILERISAPDDAEPKLTEEEGREVIERISAPLNAQPKLTGEEYEKLLERLGQ